MSEHELPHNDRARSTISAEAPQGPRQPSYSETELVLIGDLVSRLLSHYWLSGETEESRQAALEDWIDDLREFGAPIVREACREWRQSSARRPSPLDIRAICIGLQRKSSDRLAIEDLSNSWPQWLADLWGEAPEGPRKRAEAMSRRKSPEPQPDRTRGIA